LAAKYDNRQSGFLLEMARYKPSMIDATMIDFHRRSLLQLKRGRQKLQACQQKRFSTAASYVIGSPTWM